MLPKIKLNLTQDVQISNSLDTRGSTCSDMVSKLNCTSFTSFSHVVSSELSQEIYPDYALSVPSLPKPLYLQVQLRSSNTVPSQGKDA